MTQKFYKADRPGQATSSAGTSATRDEPLFLSIHTECTIGIIYLNGPTMGGNFGRRRGEKKYLQCLLRAHLELDSTSINRHTTLRIDSIIQYEEYVEY